MTFLAMTAGQAAALALFTTGAIAALYFLKLRRRRLLTPSLLLWQQILEQHQARSLFERLRNPLSLLLAIAIGLLLAMAIARPEIEALTGKHRRIAIVLDTSPTMLARTGGETRWQRAVKETETLLDTGGPTTEFRIADTSGRTDTAYTTDRVSLREKIAGMRPFHAEQHFPGLPAADAADAATVAETWFVSDGVSKLDVPPSAGRISVFESAPNVGIVAFEIRAEPASPLHYSAYLEARNYGRNAVDAAIKIVGQEGNEIQRTARLESGGRFQETFDLSLFAGSPVTASVASAGDAFELDDKAFAYIPVRRKTRVLLVTQGNAYLETALKLDPQIDLRRTDPASYTEATDIDAYVFDRFAPATAPTHPALVIGAPRAAWLPAVRGTVGTPTVVSRMDNHPVIQHVSLHDIAIRQAAKIDAGPLTVIAASKETPLIVASEAEGIPPLVLLTFALEASDFPFQPGFPVFIENTLSWFSREPLAITRPPGLVQLPFKATSIETENGKTIPATSLVGETVFEAEPGLYVATHDGARRHVAVNLLSREISNINDSHPAPASSTAPRRSLLRRELWFYMLLAALLLVVIEWVTYHRRITL